MKNIIISSFFGLFLFGMNTIANCQWTEIRPPFGINLASNIIPLNGKAYTTTHFGTNQCFVKTQDLVHWQKVSELNDIPSTNIENSYDQGIFYIFSPYNGSANLIFSNDFGISWTKIDSTQFPAGSKFFQVFNQTLFIANSNTIFKSTDMGMSWKLSKLTNTAIAGITVSKSGKIILITGSEILISADNGINWDSKSLPYTPNSKFDYFKLFSNDAGIFIATESNGNYFLYRSIDDCQSWVNVTTPNTYDNISSIISNIDGWWATAFYTYHSQDEGKTWDKGFYAGGENLINVNDTIYSTGSNGFFKSYDKARTWKSGNVGWDLIFPGFNNNPLSISEFGRHFEFYHDQLYISHYDGIYSTDVNGDEWTIFDNSGLGAALENFFVKDDSIGFYGDNGLITKDNGKNWTKIITPYGLENDPYNKLDATFARVGGSLFSENFQNSNLFKSNDWGLNWSEIPLLIDFKSIMAGSENTLFANTDQGIYSSNNLGASFEPDQAGIGPFSIDAFYSTAKGIFCLYNSSLFKYNNKLWTASISGLEKLGKEYGINNISSSDELVIACGDGYGGANSKQFFYSTDGGNSWNGDLIKSFPNIFLFQNYGAIDHTNIYISGVDKDEDLRIFKMDLGSVATYSLKQEPKLDLFPNPTTGRFKINSKFEFGAWKVFNLYGTLIKEGSTIGNEIDLSGCYDGVYYVSLSNNKGVFTKKLIIQR